MDAITVSKSKDCDSITYVKTCLPNLYIFRNCMVFDVKNDVCLVFHKMKIQMKYMCRTVCEVLYLVSQIKNAWLIYCYKAGIDVIEHQMKE